VGPTGICGRFGCVADADAKPVITDHRDKEETPSELLLELYQAAAVTRDYLQRQSDPGAWCGEPTRTLWGVSESRVAGMLEKCLEKVRRTIKL